MRKSIIDKLLHNFWTKILSVFLAVLAWCAIMNSSDPTITQTIHNISVMQTNVDVIEDDNMIPTVVKGDKIDVKISGPRSEISQLTASDINAYIDLKELSMTNSCPIHVEFKKSQNSKNCEITYKSEEAVIVSIEAMTKEAKQVQCEIVGSIAEGYYPVSSVSQLLVDVYGPIKTVSLIDHLVASVDVSGVRQTFTAKVTVVPYDAKGNVVEDSSIVLDTTSVDVTVNVYKTKTIDVLIDANVTAAKGYTCGEVNHAPKSITVAGPDVILSSLKEVVIPVEAKNLKLDYSNNFPLNDYLPAECHLVSDTENASVSVTIPVLYLSEKKTFNTTLRSIKVKNLDKKYKIDNLTEGVQIDAWCLPDSDVTLKNLELYIDCESVLDVGHYELEIKYKNTHDVYIDKIVVPVDIISSEDTSNYSIDNNENATENGVN